MLARRFPGFVKRTSDDMCNCRDDQFRRVQVIWEILEKFDQDGGLLGDLLAYVGTTVLGDGGQGPEGKMTRVGLIDEGNDFCKKTFLELLVVVQIWKTLSHPGGRAYSLGWSPHTS